MRFRWSMDRRLWRMRLPRQFRRRAERTRMASKPRRCKRTRHSEPELFVLPLERGVTWRRVTRFSPDEREYACTMIESNATYGTFNCLIAPAGIGTTIRFGDRIRAMTNRVDWQHARSEYWMTC